MISKRDQRCLDISYGVALTSNCEQRVGAVLVTGGNIIARSNRRHKHGNLDHFPWSLHAEAHAVKDYDGGGGTLYVVRISPGGQIMAAKPCHRCFEILTEKRIRRIVWSVPNGACSARPRDITPHKAAA